MFNTQPLSRTNKKKRQHTLIKLGSIPPRVEFASFGDELINRYCLIAAAAAAAVGYIARI